MVQDIEYKNGGEGGGGRPLSSQEVARLAEQIADVTRSSLPLPSGLRAFGEEVSSGALHSTLDSLATSLEAGTSLDGAIAAQGRRLPGHLRQLVQIGMRTGRIGEVLTRFAGYANFGTELRWRLLIGLLYPTILIVLMVNVFVLFLTWPIQQFKVIYQDFGVPLPLLTLVIIRISDFLTVAWQPILELLGLLIVGWFVLIAIVSAPVRRSLESRLPLIGPVWRWTSLAEFCHLLGLLLEGELSLPEAIPLAAEGARDADLAAASTRMAKDVSSGQPLSKVFSRHSVFPAGLARILSWAEGHRSLPEAMHMAGDMFAARARAEASFAGTVLSVLAVILILGGLGIVIPAIFAPMIHLISKLSG